MEGQGKHNLKQVLSPGFGRPRESDSTASLQQTEELVP